MSSLDGGSSDSAHTLELSKQPLQGLKLASHTVLEKAQQRGRSKCVKCGGSRMFFCYTCCLLVDVSLQEIPIVKVSIKVWVCLFFRPWVQVFVMAMPVLLSVLFDVFCFLHIASSKDRHHQTSQWDRWQEHCSSCENPSAQWHHHLHVP